MISQGCVLRYFLIFMNGWIVLPTEQSHLKVVRNFSENLVSDFKIYWNVQTQLCELFGVPFTNLLKKYGIIVNTKDKFRGDQINLIYDVGDFPIIKQNHEENGGIPQNGNLSLHLIKLKEDVERLVEENFTGLGIIDFEYWRPVFRQNWNKQEIYRKLSVNNTEETHPELTNQQIKSLSKKEFEESAKLFLLNTLKELQEMRPQAKWGFYGYPYCLNFRDSKLTPTCPDLVIKENNGIEWLFNESNAFYPSLYLSTKYKLDQHIELMIGALNEAFRVSSMVGFREVFPYISFMYQEDSYLSMEDMFFSLEVPRYYKMGGAIIWAKSSEVNTRQKCLNLQKYLENILGPILERTKGNEYIIDKCFEDGFLRTEGIAEDHWLKLAQAFCPRSPPSHDYENEI